MKTLQAKLLTFSNYILSCYPGLNAFPLQLIWFVVICFYYFFIFLHFRCWFKEIVVQKHCRLIYLHFYVYFKALRVILTKTHFSCCYSIFNLFYYFFSFQILHIAERIQRDVCVLIIIHKLFFWYIVLICFSDVDFCYTVLCDHILKYFISVHYLHGI